MKDVWPWCVVQADRNRGRRGVLLTRTRLQPKDAEGDGGRRDVDDLEAQGVLVAFLGGSGTGEGDGCGRTARARAALGLVLIRRWLPRSHALPFSGIALAGGATAIAQERRGRKVGRGRHRGPLIGVNITNMRRWYGGCAVYALIEAALWREEAVADGSPQEQRRPSSVDVEAVGFGRRRSGVSATVLRAEEGAMVDPQLVARFRSSVVVACA
jgi:hypothetical protein